ncbi:LmeA family phospholipid-binding protein [Nocardia sp. NPDC055165]
MSEVPTLSSDEAPSDRSTSGRETGSGLGRGLRTRKLRAALVGSGVVLALAVSGTAAAEIYYRNRIEGCIAHEVERELGSRVSVRFGPRPLLLAELDHRIPFADADSADTRFGPAVGMRVRARLHDIELADGGAGAAVGHSSAQVVWGNDGIAETLHEPTAVVASDASTGILAVSALGGLAHLELRPYVVDHRILIDTVAVRGLPTDLVDIMVETLVRSLQGYPLNLRADTLRVTDAGIVVALSGGPAPLRVDGSSGTECS